jgi:hypothetical protein
MTTELSRNLHTKRGLAILLTVVTCVAGALLPREAFSAEGTKKNTYTDDACLPDGAPCGAIVYGNKGGYTVNKVRVHGRSSQPKGMQISSACKAVDGKFTDSLNRGQYDLFVVPASCAYEIDMEIAAGRSKDLNLFLTPGCQITLTTAGTTMSNEWNISVDWTDAAIEAGVPEKFGVTKKDHPVDADGHKCGKQSNM